MNVHSEPIEDQPCGAAGKRCEIESCNDGYDHRQANNVSRQSRRVTVPVLSQRSYCARHQQSNPQSCRNKEPLKPKHDRRNREENDE
jgi:hypothetical protein